MATQRGFSIVSLVAAVAISSAIILVGSAYYQDMVEEAREILIQTQIKSHLLHFNLHQASQFQHFKSDYGNSIDYLDDAIAAGHIKPIPKDQFADPSALRWEMGKVPPPANTNFEPTFVLFIASSNPKDQALISRVIEKMSFDDDEIELVP
ncbi:type II secretion system protein [Aquipseudomonas alcaligenes]|nr:hypothetical protein [Pseudomonas alcaligenes]